MVKYIFRMDDACPTMNHHKWNTILNLLDKYEIKPIIAVIPKNEDKSLFIDETNERFWEQVYIWQKKKYNIAMHGYNHLYTTSNSGLLGINKKSEFAGVSLSEQKKKIREAYNIFKQNKIQPNIWVAPSHTFDENTLVAIKEETEIRIISDGISILPFSAFGFLWVPTQSWKFKEKQFGVWTICVHPNTFNLNELYIIESFLKNNREKFVSSIDTLYKTYKGRNIGLVDQVYKVMFYSVLSLKKWIYN